MSLFKKYGAAPIALLLVIVLVLLIGSKDIRQTANRDYYKRWVIDDAGLFSDKAKTAFADANEMLDQTYGSILGVITVSSLDGNAIGDAVYQLGEDGGFGQNDLILLIAEGDRQWYLGYGDVIAQYADQSLRLLMTESINDGIFDGEADSLIQDLYHRLADWYEQHVPHSADNGGRRTGISGLGFLIAFVRIVLLLYLVLLLVRYLLYPLLCYRRTGQWIPLWGWTLFPAFGALRQKYFAGNRARSGRRSADPTP